MRILYGVQSTGHGHISRSREIIQALKKRGHEIQVLFSGQNQNLSKEMEIFEPFVIHRGLTFITSKGRIRYLKTAVQLNFFKFYRDILLYDATDFDLVITDFEPITARIARQHRIPSIGIAHQYAFLYNIPVVSGNLLSHTIMKMFAPPDYPIGLHWHHFDQPILPPIIPDYLKNQGIIKDKILIYLPFEEQHKMKSVLQQIQTHHFFIYGNIEQAYDKEHLHFRPTSRSGFLADLADCNGVICHAGFELPSEALHLGKKILVKPILRQIEQESNALALSELNLGKVMKQLNVESIQAWLDSESNLPMNYPNVAEHIAEWVEKGCWDNISELAQSVWRKTPLD